jgi:hypothetical protein
MAVVQTRPTAAALSGRTAPAWLSEQIDVVRSAEVLGKAARDSGLTTAWQMSDAQAADRLQGLVLCEAIPGTALLELKVRKISAADPLLVCKSILKHAGEQLDANREAEIAKLAAERKAVMEKAVLELEAKLETSRAEFLAESPTRDHPGDGASRFESLVKIQADRRLLEELKSQRAREEMSGGCSFFGGVLIEHQAPHWPGRPQTRHLMDFGISAAWTFGISTLLAIVIAYLLEAMIPRKKAQETVAP